MWIIQVAFNRHYDNMLITGRTEEEVKKNLVKAHRKLVGSPRSLFPNAPSNDLECIAEYYGYRCEEVHDNGIWDLDMGTEVK